MGQGKLLLEALPLRTLGPEALENFQELPNNAPSGLIVHQVHVRDLFEIPFAREGLAPL